MTSNGPKPSFSLKPTSKPEAPAAEAALMEAAKEPAVVEKPTKSTRPIPSFLTDPRWTLSFDGPMKRGPGSKR